MTKTIAPPQEDAVWGMVSTTRKQHLCKPTI